MPAIVYCYLNVVDRLKQSKMRVVMGLTAPRARNRPQILVPMSTSLAILSAAFSEREFLALPAYVHPKAHVYTR